MRIIDRVYIDGSFVEPHGRELFDLFNPATADTIAGAIFHSGMAMGKFHGVMRPATPSGSITTSALPARRVKS